MSFDFAVSTVEAQSETNDEATEDTEVRIEFEANEVADLYLTFGDWKAVLGAMLETLDLEPLKVYGDDTLEDAARLLGEYQEAHPQQKLHLVATLAKSTAGKMQGEENSHTIGLSSGKAPEEHFEESFSYALAYSQLPTISWEGLDGGERENLEEMGINPSELGFDTTNDGPKLLTIGENRLPIAVEEGDEVMEALQTLQMLPDEPSHWDDEDGFIESSHPEVFDSDEEIEVNLDNPEGSEDTEDSSSLELAENPEKVGEFNVNEIRTEVTNIESLRTIEEIRKNEIQGKNRSSAVDRLNERCNALQGNEEADEASQEEVEEAVEETDEDDEDDEVDTGHLSDVEKEMAMHLVETNQAENIEEAAKEVTNL